MPDGTNPRSGNGSKHDGGCRRRGDDLPTSLCTCDMTDAEVAAALRGSMCETCGMRHEAPDALSIHEIVAALVHRFDLVALSSRERADLPVPELVSVHYRVRVPSEAVQQLTDRIARDYSYLDEEGRADYFDDALCDWVRDRLPDVITNHAAGDPDVEI